MQCTSGIQISGAGITIINGNKNVAVSVSNASAQVIIKGCNSVVTPSASAGNLAIVDCIVTALGGNGITITGSLTTLTLLNSQVLVTAGNNVAPISVAGIYTIINTIYDKPGSTLTGTSTNSIDYFQYINADKFITQGGTSSKYVMGDGSLSNGFTGGTVTGSTSFTNGLTANTLTATTFSSSTVNVGNTTGTPSQAASFDVDGKLVAGLGQTTYKLYGNASLPLSNATTAYFVVPGLSQTFTVPSNCSVYVFSTGGIGNTNGSSYTFTSYVGIFVDGSLQTDGGFNHINTMNPNTINVAFTNTTWSLSSILNLSVGSHTVDIRARYVNTSNAGQGAAVSGVSGNSRQGELYIIIIKN